MCSTPMKRIASSALDRLSEASFWSSGWSAPMTSYGSSRQGGPPSRKRNVTEPIWDEHMTDEMPELTEEDFASAIPERLRKRLIRGQFESGEDIAALRRFV